MSTYFPSGDGLAENRKWYVVDAEGQTVGRLATEVARVLTGKNNPRYTPFLDMGDHVIVINARKAVFKGSKAEQKVYHHHTLYPGGLRSISVKDQFAKHPERVIELAVKGMLPKNKLGCGCDAKSFEMVPGFFLFFAWSFSNIVDIAPGS